MSLRAAEPRIKESLDYHPRQLVSNYSSPQANDIDIVVFDALPGREAVMDQRSTDTFDFIHDNGGNYDCTIPPSFLLSFSPLLFFNGTNKSFSS